MRRRQRGTIILRHVESSSEIMYSRITRLRTRSVCPAFSPKPFDRIFAIVTIYIFFLSDVGVGIEFGLDTVLCSLAQLAAVYVYHRV